jgi:hypothetical protein
MRRLDCARAFPQWLRMAKRISGAEQARSEAAAFER